MSARLDVWPRHHRSWWDMMNSIQRHLGEEKFVTWLSSQLAVWEVRAAVIQELAWNDHNSEFFLNMDQIMRERTFSDGSEVTADAVAEAVSGMAEGLEPAD